MQQVVPWQELVDLIAPYAPEGRKGRPPFPVEMLLRIHFMQQWFNLSDPAMEEALHDMPLFREFVGLSWGSATPDESTILRFRHLLETHKLAEQILKTVTDLLERKKLLLRTGTIVDATLIAAPSSTKNSTKSRDPEMHQTKKEKWSRSFEQLSPVAKRDHRGYAACICANGNAAKYASSGVAWLCA